MFNLRHIGHRLPPNVKAALNRYATEDAYGDLPPVDAGSKKIYGADNVGVEGTNHCTIGYARCPDVPLANVIEERLGSDLPDLLECLLATTLVPAPNNGDQAYKEDTYKRITKWLDQQK